LRGVFDDFRGMVLDWGRVDRKVVRLEHE
jgi:hypothetical protein